jgi:hypothetical protein
VPPRKAPAKSLPPDPEQAALIRDLEKAQARAELKAEAKAVTQAKAEKRAPLPVEYAIRDRSLPVVSPDMAQVILGAIRNKVPSAIAVLRKAEQERPDMLRALIAEFRREHERRPEIFLALLETNL